MIAAARGSIQTLVQVIDVLQSRQRRDPGDMFPAGSPPPSKHNITRAGPLLLAKTVPNSPRAIRLRSLSAVGLNQSSALACAWSKSVPIIKVAPPFALSAASLSAAFSTIPLRPSLSSSLYRYPIGFMVISIPVGAGMKFAIGNFAGVVIDFLIVSAVVFLMARYAKRLGLG